MKWPHTLATLLATGRIPTTKLAGRWSQKRTAAIDQFTRPVATTNRFLVSDASGGRRMARYIAMASQSMFLRYPASEAVLIVL